ncbi:MAG TPA: tRNA pseudouridine(38-40) synthase TruA [Spirochaetota bacterium]|nr:tRNA pseudouridine(38-40) synthase TruA [Spirochaetota bacterium]HPI88062.1 tRNA pseudouridine(38-40) synthase TruA [Spirochaetota bacterium]HPR46453.1 tRNA pseudouridine(38-40) synthase TruA [Spirochaetota bacterium]
MESTNKPESRRIALLIQYDGTNYNGWQYQENGRTIQSEIESAYKVLTREDIRIVGSGRTDSGVHALGQVAHFDSVTSLKLDKICISLNGILPKDIAIINAYNVPSDFHARYSAIRREYKYLIYNHPQRSPFMMYRAMWVREHIDERYIYKTLSLLIGERDFASFCKKISVSGGTVRNISDINVVRRDDLIEFTVEGNAFLHNMIRIMVGTVIELHIKGKDPEEILTILDKKDRDFSGTTAPSYGLYLQRIHFKPGLSMMPSAF